MQYRFAQAIIDLDAIKYNLTLFKKNLPKKTKLWAVVKADGYGHGAVEVAKIAVDNGVECLCVAMLDEAIALRAADIRAEILVMGHTSPKHAAVAAKYDITLTVFQKEWLEEASKYVTEPLFVHIKLDTGMGRIGLRTKMEVAVFLKTLVDRLFIVTGVFTHFATADQACATYYQNQLKRFKQLTAPIRAQYGTNVTYHTANSAAVMQYGHDVFDAVRVGILLYGMYPSVHISQRFSDTLKPALSLTTELVHVKQINKGDYLSYGNTYKAKEKEWIGTLPIGYGDGVIRRLQGFEVLIGGKRHQIVGRVCMDQCMVKMSKYYPVGEKVTIIGRDGEAVITVEDMAEYIETINYEVTCLLTKRLPRHYLNT